MRVPIGKLLGWYLVLSKSLSNINKAMNFYLSFVINSPEHSHLVKSLSENLIHLERKLSLNLVLKTRDLDINDSGLRFLT